VSIPTIDAWKARCNEEEKGGGVFVPSLLGMAGTLVSVRLALIVWYSHDAVTDMTPKPKLKAPYTDRLNPQYGTNPNAERKQAEAFELLNSFVRHHGGSITSPPGRFVRIECPRGSALPDELRKLGYNISERGTVTRITSMDYVSPADEKFTGAPSPFAEYSVFEITLSGR
jgi:hypothetical protein